MPETAAEDICRRIAKIRMELTGPRGKSAFAGQLGLSASTYAYYESSRIPPADVLVRIADVAGVDLRWLLTGHVGSPVVAADHPVVQRAAKLLAKQPNAAAPLAAFLDILAATFAFPDAQARATEAEGPPAAQAPPAAKPRAMPPAGSGTAKAAWIPILGRSAAGVPHFWSSRDDAAGVTLLDDLVARHARCRSRHVAPATATADDPGETTVVQIITLRTPDDEGVVEFLAAEGVKRAYPDAFALRIDGDSMSPDIRHGDVVILSPSVPAADGRPAVVQLDRQIGVTCKLFRRAGALVHLIPINEQMPPLAIATDQVVWALRVLGRVRPHDGADT